MITWNAVTIVAGLVGLIGGFLLAINGFTEPTDPTDFKSSTRLRNFGWLLFGTAAAYLTDFKKLGVDGEIKTFDVLLTYWGGAVIGVIVAVGAMAFSVRRSVMRWNKQHPSPMQLDTDALVREYLTYGKTRFDLQFAQDQKAAEDKFATAKQSRGDLEKKIALCAYGVLAYVRKVASGHREDPRPWVEAIMDAVRQAVWTHSRIGNALKLDVSYMVFVPKIAATTTQQQQAIFTFDPPDRYTGYLELRYGAGYASGKRVVLPVDGLAEHQDKVLPGAPQAVVANGVAIMNIKAIEFGKDVPSKVKAEIDNFFKNMEYQSVTSLIVSDGSTVHGVINIESWERDLLGEGADAAEAACATLQPLAALLSHIVSP